MDNAFAPAVPVSIWQRLGFGTCYVPSADSPIGEIAIHSYVQLSIWGRIQVLLSGKLHIAARIETDQIVNHAQTRLAVSPLPPNFQMPS